MEKIQGKISTERHLKKKPRPDDKASVKVPDCRLKIRTAENNKREREISKKSQTRIPLQERRALRNLQIHDNLVTISTMSPQNLPKYARIKNSHIYFTGI